MILVLLAIKMRTSSKVGRTAHMSKPASIKLSNVLVSQALKPLKLRSFLSFPPRFILEIRGPSNRSFLSCMEVKQATRKSSCSLRNTKNVLDSCKVSDFSSQSTSPLLTLVTPPPFGEKVIQNVRKIVMKGGG